MPPKSQITMGLQLNGFLSFLAVTVAVGFVLSSAKAAPLHIDLEASSQELRANLKNQKKQFQLNPALSKNISLTKKTSPDLARVIEVGERNLEWLQYINKHRNPPLQFTKPGSLKGIPITQPSKYSDKIIVENFLKFTPTLLPEMQEVLLQKKAFSENPPEPIDEYLKLGNQIDRFYQNALRWQLMEPWLWWYAQNRNSDIRGYYFLKQVADLETRLKNWSLLSPVEQVQYTEWLKGQCFNNLSNDQLCESQWIDALKNNTQWDYYQLFLASAKASFDKLYLARNKRTDITWSADKKMAQLNIKPQNSQSLNEFLTHNLQDEWQWSDWRLIVGFAVDAAIEVIWQPGVTPHVNGIGGNQIYMDSNAPITEWDVQWTIRHEFGHSLGFPDCYVEFYSEKDEAMINYQIDTTDLMCSRAGKLKERHYLELSTN